MIRWEVKNWFRDKSSSTAFLGTFHILIRYIIRKVHTSLSSSVSIIIYFILSIIYFQFSILIRPKKIILKFAYIRLIEEEMNYL